MANFDILCKEIKERSRSNNWDEAKLEWNVVDMEFVDEPEMCLCGHFPIVEVFTLENKYTGENVRVGNVCVNKFIHKNKAFDGYKRILKSETASATMDLLQFARDKGIITVRDYDFYVSIIKKRVLSERQSKWKVDINLRIINHIKKARGR